MFLMAGVMKATQPREKLLKQRPWTENFSTGRVRFIGVVELLAAIGLILPAASGIAVFLHRSQRPVWWWECCWR